MENKLALVSPDELSFVENNSLNAAQLAHILKKTPPQYIKTRPAKGGGVWKYVTGGYIKKCLNLMFGWDWDFEIISEQVIHKQVVVKGRLTCRSAGKQIVKMQFGNKDIAYKTETRLDANGKTIMTGEGDNAKARKFPSEDPLDIGNDFKAACTDALKKCAAEIGIAADIYNSEDFKEVAVDTSKTTVEDLRELYEIKKDTLNLEEQESAERIINNEEKNSYSKLKMFLKSK